MKKKRQLTEEERNKILCAFHYLEDESSNEFEKFKKHLLRDNYPLEIEAIVEICEKVTDETSPSAILVFGIMYDMWANKTNVWCSNPPPNLYSKSITKEIKRRILVFLFNISYDMKYILPKVIKLTTNKIKGKILPL
jgi:hypothetical protein